MRRRDEKFPDNGFEAWGGYMQAKIAKLEQQFSDVAKEEKVSNIFCGISIYVNGYTIPSADELKTLMTRHGGVYHTYQRAEDYIIASNLPDTKVKKMSLGKVVKPEWITDSIKAESLLDYREYLLYADSRTQPRLNFKTVKNNCDVANNVSISVNENIGCMESTSNVSHALNTCKKNMQIIKTASDPNFISEFYKNSRLHHISQLGACFKQYINDLRECSNFKFPAREELKLETLSLNEASNCLSPVTFEAGKTIMHIDMDCFFVSVGLRNRQDLKGKPVAVTHSKGGHAPSKRPGVDRNAEFHLYHEKQVQRIYKTNGLFHEEDIKTKVDVGEENDNFGSMSEIASCSYEARAKGLYNGMFMGAALKLCPDLQTIPYDFEGYKTVSFMLYDTVAKYTLDIEAVSCDEMYVDCTELLKSTGINVQHFATVLRNEIKNKTGCPCSTGFGGNRLQARLATKKAKPNGHFFLSAELVSDFMFGIKLEDLPGVGRQTSYKLESMGHVTCGSLQQLPLSKLQHQVGKKMGAQLFDQCRGRDVKPLNFVTVRKSVSAEVNYGIRFETNDQCVEFLKQLCTEVHLRMKQFKVLAKCITLKLMVRSENAPVETAKFMGHGFCNIINKSTSLHIATNDIEIITKEVISLCKKQNIDPKEMRGIGIQLTKLEPITKCNKKGVINRFLSDQNCKSDQNFTLQSGSIELHSTYNSPSKTKLISPSKIKLISPTKNRSPILGVIKSPLIKRRGRPPKNVKLQSSKNLINKFLQCQTVTKDTPYKNPMPNLERQITVVSDIKSQTSKGLLDLPWEKIRELLRAWLESGQPPLQCDIDLITAYMRGMVMSRNIDKLNVLMRFIKRRTFETRCKKWMKMYEHVLENVQTVMIAVYGKRLSTDL